MVKMILFGALAVVLGVGLAILFNKLVIKNFPENRRKWSYVKTVVVFLLIAIVLFAAIYGKIIADSIIIDKSNELEQNINKNYSNLDFVKNGLDVAGISKDLSKLDKTRSDLNTFLKPEADKVGAPNFLYNIVVDNIMKQLQNIISKFNESNTANSYLNEKNFLTVSSLMNGIRTGILKIIKIIVLIIVFICVILLGIYILVSLSTASKEKKRIEGKNAG
jgi:ABC-type multidrug transport system fused ATPase/permease subunit